MLEDIRVPSKPEVLSKPNLMIEERYEDPYYLNVINDYSKFLIQKLICQVWIQHYWSDWMETLSLKREFTVIQNMML